MISSPLQHPAHLTNFRSVGVAAVVMTQARARAKRQAGLVGEHLTFVELQCPVLSAMGLIAVMKCLCTN